MDAQAYLRKHGWRGDGHSLDQSGRGIKRPLLVSKKVDVLGVGLNKHAAVSDQWWLRAFDNGLKNFGTGQESMLASVQKHGVNRGGLYGRFVKGEGVAGTFEKPTIDSDPVTAYAVTNMAVQVPEATVSSSKDRKRKHIEEAVDTEARKQQKLAVSDKQRQEKIDQAAKALVSEAVARGIIPAGKQKQKAIETDPDDPMFQMIKSTSLEHHAQLFDTGDPSSVAYKAAHDQVKREFEETARRYLLDAVALGSPPELASKKAKAKKNESSMGASVIAENANPQNPSRKAIAAQERAARKQRQMVKRTARLEKRKDNMNAILASRSAKGERFTVREAATACGIKYKQYTIKATGKAYSDYVKDNEKTPVTLDTWVELYRKSYPELELASQPVKDYYKFIQANGLQAMPGAVNTAAPDGHDEITERDQIDAYYAKKHGLGFQEYKYRLRSGTLEEPIVDLNSIDPVKLAEYRERARAKGVDLTAYIARRDKKYAAKQGEKLIQNGFQVRPAASATQQAKAVQAPGPSAESAIQYDPVAESASWFSIAEPSDEPFPRPTGTAEQMKAAQKEKYIAKAKLEMKTMKKEKKAGKKEKKKAVKKEKKAAKRMKKAATAGTTPNVKGKQGKKAAKDGNWSAMMAKRREKKKKKQEKSKAKVATGARKT